MNVKRRFFFLASIAVLLLIIGIGARAGATAPASSISADLADVPAPTQAPGEHSTLTTHDGHIRDDELADYVCQQIQAAGGQVHDVKIMFNSCYGGGMLDDFERVFGPGGACEGIPWVGSAASGPNQPAWGPSDATVRSNPRANLGSRWTNALDDAIRAGGNVQDSFGTARDNDRAGPNGYHGEDPVVASGNGGSSVGWNDATNHRAVVFGGNNNALRHDNNIENVRDAMKAVWGDDWSYFGYGWGDADTGTESWLKNIIKNACSGLDSDTQLALYFDDHGDTDFDLAEYLAWLFPETVTYEEPLTVDFILHEGWVTGLTAMDAQPNDIPAPTLALSLTEPLTDPAAWMITLNEVPIELPPGTLEGEVVLPVDWTSIISGPNQLNITAAGPTAPPMVLGDLDLGSGPINEIEDVDIPAPLQFPGEHSTLTTYDGHIRDDELADYVCEQILAAGGQVHDVKIMFNSCYGGGMLDDFERVFGPGGACEGIPWVGGAASGPDQPAWGPSDATVGASNLGSRWTNALDDAIRAGGNVQDSFETARDNDRAGPNGYHGEDPVVASGNGGSSINWTDATNHRAVVFGGYNNALRHDNNIDNVSGALGDLFGTGLTYLGQGLGDPSTGSETALKDMIRDACTGLDSDTQLVLYFDDHGDTDFDFDEYLEWALPYTIDAQETITFTLHEGWVTGLAAMEAQLANIPDPTLTISLTEPLETADWLITLNETPIVFEPGGVVEGEQILQVDWTSIRAGPNVLHFTPTTTARAAMPMVVDNLELGSGPISELEDAAIYLPLVIKNH